MAIREDNTIAPTGVSDKGVRAREGHLRGHPHQVGRGEGKRKGPDNCPGLSDSHAIRPAEAGWTHQAALENASTATVTRAVSGAIACSVSLKDASVSLPDSATVFSSVLRA